MCRNVEKAEVAAEEIRKETKGEVVVHKLDLASLKSVRECAEQLGNTLEKIDILINNAGIMTCPEMRTEEGFEMQVIQATLSYNWKHSFFRLERTISATFC